MINDESNPFPKGKLNCSVGVKPTQDVIIGADAIGQLRKMAEDVGREAAEKLVTELSVEPTVDVYLADMLIPYMALAQGKSTFC